MQKLAFFDLETSGLDPKTAQILELAMSIEINGQVVAEFQAHMRATMAPTSDGQKTLEANGLWLGSWEATLDALESTNRETPNEAYSRFEHWLNLLVNKFDKTDKLFLYGYNSAAFDDGFLRAFVSANDSSKYAYGSRFHWPTGDVAILAQYALGAGWAHLTSRKLADVCQRFGIEVDRTKLHGAKYDVALTQQLFHAVNRILKPGA